jgi:hypothetical protein
VADDELDDVDAGDADVDDTGDDGTGSDDDAAAIRAILAANGVGHGDTAAGAKPAAPAPTAPAAPAPGDDDAIATILKANGVDTPAAKPASLLDRIKSLGPRDWLALAARGGGGILASLISGVGDVAGAEGVSNLAGGGVGLTSEALAEAIENVGNKNAPGYSVPAMSIAGGIGMIPFGKFFAPVAKGAGLAPRAINAVAGAARGAGLNVAADVAQKFSETGALPESPSDEVVPAILGGAGGTLAGLLPESAVHPGAEPEEATTAPTPVPAQSVSYPAQPSGAMPGGTTFPPVEPPTVSSPPGTTTGGGGTVPAPTPGSPSSASSPAQALLDWLGEAADAVPTRQRGEGSPQANEEPPHQPTAEPVPQDADQTPGATAEMVAGDLGNAHTPPVGANSSPAEVVASWIDQTGATGQPPAAAAAAGPVSAAIGEDVPPAAAAAAPGPGDWTNPGGMLPLGPGGNVPADLLQNFLNGEDVDVAGEDEHTLNASGESAASIEAQHRLAAMDAKGEMFAKYDQNGQRSFIPGVDGVDYHAQPGETFGVMGPDGFSVFDDNGGHVPPEDLAPPKQYSTSTSTEADVEPPPAAKFMQPGHGHVWTSPNFDPDFGGSTTFMPPASAATGKIEEHLAAVLGPDVAKEVLDSPVWRAREGGKAFVRAKDFSRYTAGGKPTYTPKDLENFRFLYGGPRNAMRALGELATAGKPELGELPELSGTTAGLDAHVAPEDMLSTGEVQPRLPGDVGAVREAEHALPQLAEPGASFELTGGDDTEGARATQPDLLSSDSRTTRLQRAGKWNQGATQRMREATARKQPGILDGDPEAGGITPEALRALAYYGGGAGAGALAGPELEPDNPTLGIVAGGLSGMAAVALLRNPEALAKVRASNLFSGAAVPKKALSDLGVLATAALERPGTGGRILGNIATPETAQAFGRGVRSGHAYDVGSGKGFREPFTAIMSGETAATQNVLGRSGFSPEEAEERTFTNIPKSEFGKGLVNLARTKIGSVFEPVAKIPVNNAERGLERMPGVGLLPGIRKMGSTVPVGRLQALGGLAALAGVVGAHEARPGGALEDVPPAVRNLAPFAGAAYMLPIEAGTIVDKALEDGGPEAAAAAWTEFKKDAGIPSDLTLGEYIAEFTPGGGASRYLSPTAPQDYDTRGMLFGPWASRLPFGLADWFDLPVKSGPSRLRAPAMGR